MLSFLGLLDCFFFRLTSMLRCLPNDTFRRTIAFIVNGNGYFNKHSESNLLEYKSAILGFRIFKVIRNLSILNLLECIQGGLMSSEIDAYSMLGQFFQNKTCSSQHSLFKLPLNLHIIKKYM